MTGNYQEKLAHLLACGVPELEAEAVAKGLRETATTHMVREFAASPQTFCLLSGGAGSGKTVAAAEALLSCRMHWLEDGAKKSCYSPSEATFALASELARLSLYDSAAIKRLGRVERVPWLVLDDVGGEFASDVWKSNFTEIILCRHSRKAKTLITTNLPIEVFRERYDERVISRIRGAGTLVSTGAIDMRRASK